MTNNTQLQAIASLSEAVAFSQVAPRAVPRRILMCPPTYFDVKDAKNEFMSGNIGAVDTGKAQAQWSELKSTFEKCGFPVELIEPGVDLEDMVFTANQVLPALDVDAHPVVVLGRMAYQSRTREVPHFEKWFAEQGYKVLHLPEVCKRFEGGGDGVWHPGRKLLWLGFGTRTEERCCDALVNLLQVPVVKLRLVSAKFYHLDTCFAVLNADSVMIYPPAFDETGLSLIRNYFQNVVEVSEADANNFACNALALDDYVVIQKGSHATCSDLQRLGFKPVEVDTSEFMKSGGSVFCMKQMVY
ncbi:MAG: amidinotransferase [Cyanobacteria bacterium SZAS LIN-5]|nr:amidinotransferase [Cyanobacteria bacterium SZAS LIN-5]